MEISNQIQLKREVTKRLMIKIIQNITQRQIGKKCRKEIKSTGRWSEKN